MQAGRDLTVVRAPQCARVLPRDAHRQLPLLREARVVDDQRFDSGQLAFQLAGEPAQHLALAPVGLPDAVEQSLPHRADLFRRIHQPRRHRLHALALAVEQQPDDVITHRRFSLDAAHSLDHPVEVLAQLSLQPRQLSSIHLVL